MKTVRIFTTIYEFDYGYARGDVIDTYKLMSRAGIPPLVAKLHIALLLQGGFSSKVILRD